MVLASGLCANTAVAAAISVAAPAYEIPELHPNPGPESLPPELTWKTWAAGALLVAIASSAIALFWHWLLRPRPIQPIPAHVWALRELDRLGALSLRDQAELEKFYLLVSNTLRQYLQARFQLNAPQQTTPEFLESLKRSDQLSAEQKTCLAEFLKQADLVKFARSCPSTEETGTLLSTARRFVEETARHAPPTPLDSRGKSLE